MSRSNYDKPFYVDVGTSIVAVRCASNHDVIERYDYMRNPYTLKLAEDVCDRMNKEAEIGRPRRNCDRFNCGDPTKDAADAYDEWQRHCDDSLMPPSCKVESAFRQWLFSPASENQKGDKDGRK